jgi:hypothetical protein
MTHPSDTAGIRERRERPSGETTPVVLTCECGHTLPAARRARHQFVPCARCGRELFVLPRSPWPVVRDADGTGPATADARPAGGFWRRPLFAGGVTLVAVAVGFAILLPVLWPRGPSKTDRSVEAMPLEEQIGEGRRAFDEGAFRVSARMLEAALGQIEKDPKRRTPAERRQLAHLQREAALLSDLLEQPLADVLARGEGMPEREWREVFRTRYQGRAVVFDSPVRRDAAGRVELRGWEESVNGVEVRLELGRVRLLQRLPLADERRLVFGVRLADARRENRGWVVSFEPDSGVLLTDPGVFAGTSLPRDPELQAVMNRQTDWIDSEAP